MKKKVLIFVSILILSLWAIHCEKGMTPFNPESDAENQAGSEANSGDANTASQRTGAGFIGVDKKLSTLKGNLKEKNDIYTQRVPVDNRFFGKDARDYISVFKDKKVRTVNETKEIEKVALQDQKKMIEAALELRLRIQPDHWNKNWVNSEGLVTARIRGEGFDKLVPQTIKMGYGPCQETHILQNNLIDPVFEQLGGSSYMVKFRHSDAIALITEITDPKRGEKHWIHVSGDVEGADPFCLDYEITIVGKKDEVDLSLHIRPKKWNVAWANSDTSLVDDDDGNGLITARISGSRFEEIDLGSVSMGYGECPSGNGGVLATVIPVSEQMGGSAYIAKFDQSQALGLIQELKAGETHYIHVTGNLSENGPFCLDIMITLVGKKLTEEELTLDIKPDKWDVSWVDSTSITLDSGDDGYIRARIRGEGFENIDPSSVKMTCASCTETGELTEAFPTEHEFGGSSLVAKFLKSDAIRLIRHPKRGDTYLIKVNGSLNDETPFETTDMIEIKGKKK